MNTTKLQQLGNIISTTLEELRHKEGWSVDDLANYLEINSFTLRNSLSAGKWSDMCVTILKLKLAISESFAYEYKREYEREKIRKRKDEAIKNYSGKVHKISPARA